MRMNLPECVRVCAGAAAVIAFLTGTPAGADTVVLRASAAVDGPYVRLAELVDPEGMPADRAEAWREVFLGAAPATGAARTIRREDIVAELRKRGEPVRDLTWEGPAAVVVETDPEAAAREAGKDRLRDRLAGAIRGLLLGAPPTGAPVEIGVHVLSIDVAGGKAGDGLWRVGRVEPSAGTENPDGRRSFTAILERDGAAPRACGVVARVRFVQTGVRLRRTLPAGTVLLPSDLEVSAAPVEEFLPDAYTSVDALAGSRLRVRIEKGGFLRAALVRGPSVVRGGDALVVTVRGAGGRVSVSYSAVALETGAAGDTIRVRHALNRAEGYARVTGTGVAEVVVPEAPEDAAGAR